MDITVFENSIRNYLRTKYGVVYTSGINLTQIPDGDMFIYSCKLSLNNNDKPLSITGQYPDLDSFLLSLYKEIDSRRFYTTEYFTLRNVEELSTAKPAAIEKQVTPCVSTVDTVGDIYLKVLEKINPQLVLIGSDIELLSSTLDILSTTVYSEVFNTFRDAIVTLDNEDVIVEIGASGSINLVGNIEQNDDTEIVSSSIDYGFGEIELSNTFGEIETSDSNVLSDRTYIAKVVVKRRNVTKTLTSNEVKMKFTYPFFYGVTNSVLQNTEMYSLLTKDISLLSNKEYTLNGSQKYLYFLLPASYPTPKYIFQNGINVKYAFTLSTAFITSTGLVNNWTQNYKILKTTDKTTVENQEFLLSF